MDCPPWQKNSGRCREVETRFNVWIFRHGKKTAAVVERWSLVEARLYNIKMMFNSKKLTPQH